MYTEYGVACRVQAAPRMTRKQSRTPQSKITTSPGKENKSVFTVSCVSISASMTNAFSKSCVHSHLCAKLRKLGCR